MRRIFTTDRKCQGDCMRTVHTYRDLEAWLQGMTLVERCYELTRCFPIEEQFGITAQLRRAAVSIPTNLAEGHSRRSHQAFVNHVSIAIGSQAELETLLELAKRLRLAPVPDIEAVTEAARSVGRLTYGLHRSLTSDRR